jgi:hypothetical protein
MRLGCLGCLGTAIGLIAILCLAVGALWTWNGLYGVPALLPSTLNKADPALVERKLAEIGLRGSGRSARSEPLVLSEAEVTTLVSGHVADAGLRLAPVAVSLRSDRISVQGRVPLDALIRDSPMAWVGSVLPGSTLASPVWVTLSGRVELAAPSGPRRARYAEATLVSARLGRIPAPTWLLGLMLGSRGASLLRWQVPGVVDRLEVGEGRITVRTH